MKIKISFILMFAKKSVSGLIPIYLRLRRGTEKLTIATGILVDPADWNKVKQRLSGRSPENESANATIDALFHRVTNLINQQMIAGGDLSLLGIKTALVAKPKGLFTVNDAFQLYMEMIKPLLGNGYSPITLAKFEQTKSRCEDFFLKKYRKWTILCTDLSDSIAEDFEQYLRSERGNNKTTVSKHWQRLSCVVKYAYRKKKIDRYPFEFYSIRPQKKVINYLTKAEIARIEEKDFDNQRLNAIRDVFLFSIYSGLSYRDMFNLETKHIKVDNEGQVHLNFIRQKTKEPYRIPLVPQAVVLLRQFEAQQKVTKKRLVPIPTNQKMNAYLKEIQTVCKIETLLTCHLARRTYACTILLGNGVSLAVTSKLMGHANMNITVASYATVQEELLKREFNDLLTKIDSQSK